MATLVATPVVSAAKVDLDVTFTNTAVLTCRIERLDPSGEWIVIRAGEGQIDLTNGAAHVEDYEVPLDAAVSYRVTQLTPAGAESATSAVVTVASGGWSWLKDPMVATRNLRLTEVTNIETLTFTSRAGAFAVLDRARPVVVASRRADFTGELRCTTATEAERLAMEDLISRGQILLLSTPQVPSYGFGHRYVHVGDVTQSRVGIGPEPTRAWVLPITAVDRPAVLATTPLGIKWSDVATGYLDWVAVVADNASWTELVESEPL